MAFHALTDEKPHNTEYRILGPELLTHDQVNLTRSTFELPPNEVLTTTVQIAEKLSSRLGREIVNVKLTDEERVLSYIGQGLPEYYAKFMTYLETGTARGIEEERTSDAVERVTGRTGHTFDAFAEENKAAWH